MTVPMAKPDTLPWEPAEEVLVCTCGHEDFQHYRLMGGELRHCRWRGLHPIGLCYCKEFKEAPLTKKQKQEEDDE
jgi:hypothetical protein